MTETRKTCLQGERRCRPNGLEQMIECTAHHNERHSFGEISQAIGTRRDALSRRTNGRSLDLTLREAIAIVTLTDDRRLVEELARRVGGVFFRMPDAHSADEDVYSALSAAVEEMGQDSGIIRRILSDRAVSVDEADQADREIDETIAALVRLKATVRAKVAKPVLATTRRLA